MTILDQLDKESFANDFLTAYLSGGFTTMTKREIDLLVLRLLIEHSDGWSFENPPTAFEIAQKLRAKRGKVRSMMDELSYRQLTDETEALRRLRIIIENRIREENDNLFESDKVRIQIEDGYLREFAKDLVQKDYGIVDSSFNSSIIVLSGDKFLALAFEVMPEGARAKIEDELLRHRDELAGVERQKLFRMFIEQAVKGAGSEIGKKAVQLGVTALSGGMANIPSLVREILKLGRDHNDS